MDMGVGSFVFAQGFASGRRQHRVTSGKFQRARPGLLRRLLKLAPIIALGAARVVAVKGVEYPVRIQDPPRQARERRG